MGTLISTEAKINLESQLARIQSKWLELSVPEFKELIYKVDEKYPLKTTKHLPNEFIYIFEDVIQIRNNDEEENQITAAVLAIGETSRGKDSRVQSHDKRGRNHEKNKINKKCKSPEYFIGRSDQER